MVNVFVCVLRILWLDFFPELYSAWKFYYIFSVEGGKCGFSHVANFIIFNFLRFASTPECNSLMRLWLLLFAVVFFRKNSTYLHAYVPHDTIHTVSNHNNFTFYAFVVSYCYYYCCSHWLFIVNKSFLTVLSSQLKYSLKITLCQCLDAIFLDKYGKVNSSTPLPATFVSFNYYAFIYFYCVLPCLAFRKPTETSLWIV